MNGRTFIAGLGTVAGGMLVAGLAQLGAAPAASADVQDIINSIDGTFTIGQEDAQTGLDYLTAGNVPEGLSYEFGALNTYSLDPLADVLYGGYESLEGVSGPYPVNAWPDGLDYAPTTLAAANADAADELAYVQTSFTEAVTAFGDGNTAAGAFDVFGSIGALEEAPELEIIGLADALSGSL
jgi:hypothetical protein